MRAEIADLFECRSRTCASIVPYLGGGFGSKSYTKMEPITVALARKAGRPVRIQNRVDESMVTTRRHGMNCRMRTAATARRHAARAARSTAWFDTGAYADNGPRVVATGGRRRARARTAGQAYRVDARCVYTNTAPAGSYRAFGATHLQWIGESQIDELARRAGLDPLEMRRQNLLPPGRGGPRRGGKPLDADLVGDVEKVAAAVGWDEPKPADRRPRRLGRAARGRRASGLDARSCGWRPTATSSCSSARPRSGRGRAPCSRRSRPRSSASSVEQVTRARRRHAAHALRPLDRRQPLDHARRPRRAARRQATVRASSSAHRRRAIRHRAGGDYLGV